MYEMLTEPEYAERLREVPRVGDVLHRHAELLQCGLRVL